MKSIPHPGRDAEFRPRAFTLVELLVVVAIIAVLAGLTVMILPGALSKSRIAATKAQMKALESAIQHYYEATGSYPPDNPTDTGRSPLVFELLGNEEIGNDMVTMTGLHTPKSKLMMAYGVPGFQNSAANGATTKNYYPDLKPGLVATNYSLPNQYYFVVPYKGTNGDFNVWHYRSTKPEHNRKSYDLSATIVVGNRSYTIKNWND